MNEPNEAPRTVAAALARNATQTQADDSAARQAKADAEAEDTPETLLRLFLDAAHDSPGGAAFAEPVRRTNALFARHDRDAHRIIPEAEPVDEETARRVLASTDAAADNLVERENATRAALLAAGEPAPLVDADLDPPPPAPPAPAPAASEGGLI